MRGIILQRLKQQAPSERDLKNSLIRVILLVFTIPYDSLMKWPVEALRRAAGEAALVDERARALLNSVEGLDE